MAKQKPNSGKSEGTRSLTGRTVNQTANGGAFNSGEGDPAQAIKGNPQSILPNRSDPALSNHEKRLRGLL